MNNVKQKYLKRFAELIAIGENIPINTQLIERTTFVGEYKTSEKKSLPLDSFIEWQTACITILDAAIPKSSIHRKEIEKLANINCSPSSRDYLVAFLKAISKDFEQDYFERLETQIDAEVSSDYLHQAERLLDHGTTNNKSYIAAAAVTGAVLERGLRLIAQMLDPPEPTEVNDKRLQLNSLIEVLKKRQVYNELKAKQLRAWADIRNAVAHGKFDEFDEKEVENMVKGVSEFLAQHHP